MNFDSEAKTQTEVKYFSAKNIPANKSDKFRNVQEITSYVGVLSLKAWI